MHPRWYRDRPPLADRGSPLGHRDHRVRPDPRGLFLPHLEHLIDRQTHLDHRDHRGHDLGHRDHLGPRGRLAAYLDKAPDEVHPVHHPLAQNLWPAHRCLALGAPYRYLFRTGYYQGVGQAHGPFPYCHRKDYFPDVGQLGAVYRVAVQRVVPGEQRRQLRR